MADGRRVGWHVAPGQHLASLALYGCFNRPLFAFSAKEHGNAENGYLYMFCTFYTAKILGHHLPEESVRYLQQQPGAVAGFGVVARRAAVHEPLEDRHALHDDLVARLAGKVRDHSHATGVVFEFASVKSLVLVHCQPLSIQW